MPIRVSCPRCGTEHHSRVRARTRSDFARVNAGIGTVLERCPGCGAWSARTPTDRVWEEEPSTRRRTGFLS
jgi:uncharacterized Zn finger protein